MQKDKSGQPSYWRENFGFIFFIACMVVALVAAAVTFTLRAAQ